jgi:hypothetical protein
VGDTNDATAPIEGVVLPNANNIPRFVKAGPGAVTVEMLAAFVGDSGAATAGTIGWYNTPSTLNELLALGSGDSGQHQELNPTIASGTDSFDPGVASFGLWSNSPTFPGRIVYSENALNTWDSGIQKHEVFPYRDINGVIVPNAYLVGVEEATNNDFQDYVYVIRNVTPFVPGVPGDYNADNTVDTADYIVWRKNLGQAVALPNENVTLGQVTQEDYTTWQANYGMTAGAGAAASLSSPLRVFEAPSLSTSQSEESVATAAAFAALGEHSRADDVRDDFPFVLPDISSQIGQRGHHSVFAEARQQSSDDSGLRSLDHYFEQLQRRSPSRSEDSESLVDRDADDSADPEICRRAETIGRGLSAVVGKIWQ